MTITKTPEHIGFVNPLTVAPESTRSERLRYDRLGTAVSHSAEPAREWERRFWDEPVDGLSEREAAEELAVYYLLKTATKALGARTYESRQMWADRFTDASIERFGSPDPDIARSLNDNPNLLDDDTSTLLSELGQVIEEKYNDVFKMLDASSVPDVLDAGAIADYFESTLGLLIANHDANWSEWKIVRDPDRDSLVVYPDKREIVIGMKRAAVSKLELRGLVAHEVLGHAQRALNGYKISEQFGKGLPGNMDIEEGIACAIEYAVTGKIPQKIVDRYTDIALALGMIDGRKHSRSEVIDNALKRANEMNANKPLELQQSSEVIEAEVYKNVNRIYRGTSGDEIVGVFTKDHVYYSGFIAFCEYIKGLCESDMPIEQVYDYIMQARFNPLDTQHVDELENVTKAIQYSQGKKI